MPRLSSNPSMLSQVWYTLVMLYCSANFSREGKMILDVWEVTSGTLSRQNSFDCIVFVAKILNFWHVFFNAKYAKFFRKVRKDVALCLARG